RATPAHRGRWPARNHGAVTRANGYPHPPNSPFAPRRGHEMFKQGDDGRTRSGPVAGPRQGIEGESKRTGLRGGRDMNEERVAHALGWFSIGLGLAEVLAGKALGKALGMEDRVGLIRGFGAREIATGFGILSQPRPTMWIWGRVAGDAMD